jgi:hypothetical protein
MDAHGVLLVGANGQIGARLCSTKQNESRGAILGKVHISVAVVHFTRPDETTCAGEASALPAHGRKYDSIGVCRTQDVLVGTYPDNYFGFLISVIRDQQLDGVAVWRGIRESGHKSSLKRKAHPNGCKQVGWDSQLWLSF